LLIVGIFIAGLIGFCIFCLVTSSVINKFGLIPTSAPSQIPTELPINTETPSIGSQDYPLVVSTRFDVFKETWTDFLIQNNQLIEDIAIANNNDFYFKTQSIIFNLETRVSEMSSMNGVPTEYETFHKTINEINQEMILLGQNYNLVLDNQDQSALSAAQKNIDNINLLLEKAASELQSAKP
jgi:hypothetical protein